MRQGIVFSMLAAALMVFGCADDGANGADGTDGQDGLDGLDGGPGQPCWDLNGNGVGDLDAEDHNWDGVVDVIDCQFPSDDFDLTEEEIAAIEERTGVAECLACHKATNPNMWQDFVFSRMAAFGEVACTDCHANNDAIADGNEGHRFLPKPETCRTCHPNEYEGHRANRHSIASIRNYECGRFDDFPRVFDNGSGYHFNDEDVAQLQDLMESGGNGAGANYNVTAIAKCMQCHNVENRCDSCHTRHKFSTDEARHPGACGTCHMGPDHPQIEMYETSKHGVMFDAEGDTYRVPVCVDCHMPYNGKIFDKKTDGSGNEYVSHDLSETIAYGPVGGGTTRKGFVQDSGRVKLASKEAAGVAEFDEVWYDWEDGKVYTDATGTTVAFDDIYVMSIADFNDNDKHDYAVVQPADDAATLEASRDLMLGVCTKCHANNFADERLLVADLIHENTKIVHNEALDLVVALAATDIGPYSNSGDIPVNPETGDLGYAANMKIRNLTELEREYFHVMKYDQVKTWKGAYHFNPDYTHWYGWTAVNMGLGAMGDMATQQVLMDIWINGDAYPGAAGDIWEDGMYQGVLFITGMDETTEQVENFYDKFPGAGDDYLDWLNASGAITWLGGVPGDGIADNLQEIDINLDGVADLTKDDGSSGTLPAGTWRAIATDKVVTFH